MGKVFYKLVKTAGKSELGKEQESMKNVKIKGKLVAFLLCIVMGTGSSMPVIAAENVSGDMLYGHIECECERYHEADVIASTDLVDSGEFCWVCNNGYLIGTYLGIYYREIIGAGGCAHYPNGIDIVYRYYHNSRTQCTYCGYGWTEEWTSVGIECAGYN